MKNEKKIHGLTGRSRPKEVCEKISKALKGKPKKNVSWLKGRSGKDHPSFKHGKGNLRASNPEELAKLTHWKLAVLRNYSYKCFLTGSTNTTKTPLVCHHLESWDQNPNLRFHIPNGVVLERKIHKKFHDPLAFAGRAKVYGFGKNTIDQFEHFCFDHYQIVVFP